CKARGILAVNSRVFRITNTLMQGFPSHSPMAVPTTPGRDIKEPVCCSSTASMVCSGMAFAPGWWSTLRVAQAAAAPTRANRATVLTNPLPEATIEQPPQRPRDELLGRCPGRGDRLVAPVHSSLVAVHRVTGQDLRRRIGRA